MTTRRPQAEPFPVLLTVEEAADRLNTRVRFVRRLIAERRIEFHHVGRHVRIAEGVLAEFIAAGRVPPLDASDAWCAIRRAG